VVLASQQQLDELSQLLQLLAVGGGNTCPDTCKLQLQQSETKTDMVWLTDTMEPANEVSKDAKPISHLQNGGDDQTESAGKIESVGRGRAGKRRQPALEGKENQCRKSRGSVFWNSSTSISFTSFYVFSLVIQGTVSSHLSAFFCFLAFCYC
jgi:hypothetical protein